VYLGGAVDDFLWSVDVRSCGKLPNLGFAANEPLWMRDMRCVQNLLPSFQSAIGLTMVDIGRR
jgi:hypothetical protein